MAKNEELNPTLKRIIARNEYLQLILVMEELAELSQAVSKYYRYRQEGSSALKITLKSTLKENLVEEIADVEIMLEQLKYILSNHHQELKNIQTLVDVVKDFKINRLKSRLDAYDDSL